MDLGIELGAGDRSAPEDSRAAKRVMVTVDNGNEKLLTLLAKACLSSLQQHRALRAILLMVFWIRTDSLFSSSMRQATTGFEQKAKALRESGKQSKEVTKLVGLRHVHAWNAVCKATLEKLKAAGEGREGAAGDHGEVLHRVSDEAPRPPGLAERRRRGEVLLPGENPHTRLQETRGQLQAGQQQRPDIREHRDAGSAQRARSGPAAGHRAEGGPGARAPEVAGRAVTAKERHIKASLRALPISRPREICRERRLPDRGDGEAMVNRIYISLDLS
mmetsp:Transcript_41397/g.111179  ORF Transcript_41397/g.111179 Transcript_41397/m.111179 type:complete len:275 (-) Transcript_41397:20-844(-)